MNPDDSEIILEISAPGATTITSRILLPRSLARRGIGRLALRDWIAKRRRSRFRIVAGGLPTKRDAKIEAQLSRCDAALAAARVAVETNAAKRGSAHAE